MLNICHSYYSLKFGTASVKTIIESAKNKNITTLALCDINRTSAAMEFYRECIKNNIKPILGAEFRTNHNYEFTCLSTNNEGFKEINQTISELNANKINIKNHCFSKNVIVIRPLLKYYNSNNELISSLRDNEFIGIKPNQISLLYKFHEQADILKKCIIYNPVTHYKSSSIEIHKHLRAIALNTLISKLETKQTAGDNEILHTHQELEDLYLNYPAIIKNTRETCRNIAVNFDLQKKKNKNIITNQETDKQKLKTLALTGIFNRYTKDLEYVKSRIESELKVIFELNFTAYYLITYDIIQYARKNNIKYVGRGSGANSIVAYCLNITDVDPIELDLYFERFLNPKRSSPPDFDIDFSWKDRDGITQYILDKYGYNNTALLGTFTTFKAKSLYRELGKVYGLPDAEIEKMQEGKIKQLNIPEETLIKILTIAEKLKDFPANASIHAGGILISEESILNYTAYDLPPKGFRTVQWDMYMAEDAGFDKLDILSQRGLGHIEYCLNLINKQQKTIPDIYNFNEIKTDPNINKHLQTGNTIGCFYIESPAMRGLLKKTKCNNYLTLVAVSSIIRPGVAKSGMMKEYIKRHHTPEKTKYLHPVLKEQLSETYGIPVYQEDVLKLCKHYAGMSLADADILRRAMSGKFRSQKAFEKIKEAFFNGAEKLKRPKQATTELWRRIQSFAGYSFSKAHSASYAVESYQSLFLKTYFPLEFMVSVINNFGGFYGSETYFIEAKRNGAKISLPDINFSDYLTSLHGKQIYIGFIHIKSLEKNTVNKILKERNNGTYSSFRNFLSRVNISNTQIQIMIRAGAFNYTKKTKAELLWTLHLPYEKAPQDSQTKLFTPTSSNKYKLPNFVRNKLIDAYDEIELLDFPVSMSRFEMLKTSFRGNININELNKHIGKIVKVTGYLIALKYIYTSKKEIMNFGTFVDHFGNYFDTIHFPQSLKQYPFRGKTVYLILGKVTTEYGHESIEVEKMAPLALKANPI